MTNPFSTQFGISGYEQNCRALERAELHLAYAIENTEPVVCSVFGCDHHLTPGQQLFGTKCPAHSGAVTELVTNKQ